MIIKDDILVSIADHRITELLNQSMILRQQFEAAYSLSSNDGLLIDFARNLEEAAICIAADCAGRKLITWDHYRVIRNIIDHIGTGVPMEDLTYDYDVRRFNRWFENGN